MNIIFSSYFPFCELKKAIFQNLSIQLMGCMISEADYWLTRQDCSTMNDFSKRALQLIYCVLRVVVFKLFSFRKLVKLINATSCYLTVKDISNTNILKEAINTAAFFDLFTFTKQRDWSIWKIDKDDWLRAVAGIQNGK